MHNRRKNDRAMVFLERPSGVMVFLVDVLIVVALGAILAVIFSANGARAATPTATVYATEHDPLRGTSRYTAALERLRYAGPLPPEWSVRLHTPASTITGVLESLTYRAAGDHAWRADLEYRVWVQGRVFAAGFEK